MKNETLKQWFDDNEIAFNHWLDGGNLEWWNGSEWQLFAGDMCNIIGKYTIRIKWI